MEFVQSDKELFGIYPSNTLKGHQLRYNLYISVPLRRICWSGGGPQRGPGAEHLVRDEAPIEAKSFGAFVCLIRKA